MVNIDEKEGRLVFSLRVSPGASRARILGEHAGALKISVSAAPEKGKANKAVVEFLAGVLGVKKSDISVVSGETSRDKRIAVRGLDAKTLSDKLSALIT